MFVLLLGCGLAAAESRDPVYDKAALFRLRWTEWASTVNVRNPATMTLKEVEQWRQVERAFKALQAEIREVYGKAPRVKRKGRK